MPTQLSTCEVISLIEKLERFLNEEKFIPATSFFRSKVLLSLMSKALTTGRAVCALVDAGFYGEAFGLSRTLIDIFLTVRYISNKDTEKRAKEYVEYIAKTQEELIRLSHKHFPEKVDHPKLGEKFSELAKAYRSAHRWTEARIREMALEPDSYEVDSQGGGGGGGRQSMISTMNLSTGRRLSSFTRRFCQWSSMPHLRANPFA